MRSLLGALLLLSATAGAEPAQPWAFRTRALITGSSEHSEPDGYKVYSGITLEAGLGVRVVRWVGLELTVRSDSREIDVADRSGGDDVRLGSIQFLPMNLIAQVRPPWRSVVHPYLGAGLNLTVAWEKSGALDSTDVSPSVGPVVQLGVDVDLGSYILFNADLRWNAHRTDLEDGGAMTATLKLDGITMAAGLGVRF